MAPFTGDYGQAGREHRILPRVPWGGAASCRGKRSRPSGPGRFQRRGAVQDGIGELYGEQGRRDSRAGLSVPVWSRSGAERAQRDDLWEETKVRQI